MNIHRQRKPHHRFRSNSSDQRGVALVAVLAVLVLLTLLVVAFLIRAQSERSSSANYLTTTNTRLLSDTVVNLVEAEINDATTTGRNNTWASQPGAIRAYNNSGNLVSIYRLYSAPSLTATAASQLANDLPPTTWASSPSVWTDLNAPVTVKGMTDASGNAVASYQIYPILDNRNPTNTALPVSIPGFFVNTVNGGSTFPTNPTGTLNPPVMPVQWLYVVKNGAIIAPDQPATGTTVTFNTVAAANAPSASNPIVGRIAYWTDDECAKLDINTAASSMSNRPDSGGHISTLPSPWETPKFGIWDEFKLFSRNQPVHGEYQRYPGHPATTDLYSVFNALGLTFSISGVAQYSFPTPTTPGIYNGDTGTLTTNNPDGQQSIFFSLLPRYNDDFSSKGGVYNTTVSGTANTPVAAANITITTKRDRLYTSLGEFLYAQLSPSYLNSSNSPMYRGRNAYMNTSGTPVNLTRQQIETAKFFLTAHNRAPEVNLFGTPRIAMWPIDSDYTANGNGSQYLSTFDKIIAFCSSYGTGSPGAKYDYFIQRHDSTSATADAGIARNVQLYSYLQALTSASIPGFGGIFGGTGGKYANKGEINQILTEMVDYIRCTNTHDWSFVDPNPATTQPWPRYTPAYSSGSSGSGQIVPLQIVTGGVTTRGLGRIYTISEAGILVICTADGNNSLGTLNASNSRVTGITNGSVPYTAPVTVTGIGLVSPVIGSATDPKYVSNLPVAQFLRLPTGTGSDGNPGSIVGIDGTANYAASNIFPANLTLTTTGTYVSSGSLTAGSLTPVSIGQKRLQAMMLFELSNPMLGYNSSQPNLILSCSNLEALTIAGGNPFPSTADGALSQMGSRLNMVNECGGVQGFQYTIATAAKSGRTNGWDTTGANTYKYVSNPFTVTSTGPLTLGGGPITVQILVPAKSGSTNNTDQTFNLTFPQYTTPMPDLIQYGLTCYGGAGASAIVNPWVYVQSGDPATIPNSNPADWWGFDNRIAWAWLGLNAYSGATSTTGTNSPNANTSYLGPGTVIRTDVATLPSTGWTYINPGKVTYLGSTLYSGNAPVSNQMVGLIPSVFYRDIKGATPASPPPSDVVRTIVAFAGDTRLEVAKPTVTADTTSTADMIPHPVFYDPNGSNVKLADSFMVSGGGGTSNPGVDLTGSLYPGAQYEALYVPKALNYSGFSLSNSATFTPTKTWDWDSGTVGIPDGAYANKPDEGNTYVNSQSPYYNGQSAGTVTVSWFSANRIINSPVMFGSLPTGVMESIPWKTLLFRPGYTYSDGGSTYKHPSVAIPLAGANAVPTPPYTTPPDELLLDLFDMPVVEPYAISEPFSTAGKVNMNYQIVPFTYITRDTAVRAVLSSEMMARVPLGSESQVTGIPQTPWYKESPPSTPAKPVGSPINTNTNTVTLLRIPLDVTSDYATPTTAKSENVGTLAQFQSVFASGDIFRSPAQICDIYLVPNGASGTTYSTSYAWPGFDKNWYGSDFAMDGDNVRERPYADIYPRLTTKSNTFTVHYRVQVLKNPPNVAQNQWSETTGVVAGEYRGSTTLERYLDPTVSTIPDYASATNPLDPTNDPSLDTFYQWRTVSNNAFAP
jgi:uncharacterized protein (TIGR02600 family)